MTDAGRETIVVRCSYAVQADATTAARRTVAVAPHPGAVHEPAAQAVSFDDSGTDRFTSIFDEPVRTNGAARPVAVAALTPAAAAPAATVAAIAANVALTANAAIAAAAGLPATTGRNPLALEVMETVVVGPAAAPVVAGGASVPAPTVVMFNKPSESSDGPWFSFDYKGGSFLCKPAPLPPVDDGAVPVDGDG